MAEDKIERKEVIAEGIYDEYIAQAEIATKKTNDLERGLNALLVTSEKAAKSDFAAGIKDLKIFTQNIEKSEAAIEGLNKVQEQRKKIITSLNAIEKAQKEGLEALQIELEKLQKRKKEIAKLEKRGIVTAEQAAKERAKTNIQIKATTQAINQEQKAILQAQKVKAEATKDEKERLRLQQRLTAATKKQAVENAKLRIQIAQQNKVNKEQAKEELGLIDNFERTRKKVAQLQREYVNLALEKGKNSKEARVLEKRTKSLAQEFSDLNQAVGNGKQDVGRYKQELQSLEDQLTETLKALKDVRTGIKLLGATAVIGLILEIGKAFATNRENAQSFQRVLVRFQAFVQVFAKSITVAFQNIPDVFATLSAEFQIFTKEAKLALLGIANIFSQNDKAIEALRGQIAELKKEIKGSKTGVDSFTASFDGFFDRVGEVIKIQDELIKQTVLYDTEIKNLERSLIDLREEQAKQIAIQEDDTLSFARRTEAAQKAQEANEAVANTEASLANKRLEIAEKSVRAELAASGITIKTRSGIVRAISNSDIAIKASAESIEAFQEAFLALGEAQLEAANVQFDTAQKRRKLISDLLERDLDILIDGVDNIKTINERIIADESQVLANRRALLAETEQLLTDSFDKQEDTIRQFGIAVIASDKDLMDEQKKQALERIEALDIASLVGEQDAVVLNERIRALGLSEIFEGRLLEVIRDRRTALLDITEASRDLTQSEISALETKKDIAEQERILQELATEGADLEKILDQLSKDRLRNDIDNLQIRLDLAKDGSTEFLDLQKQLNDKLIEQQKGRIKEEEKNEKATLKNREELAQSGFDFLRNLNEKRADESLNAIDSEIDKVTQRQEELRALAQNSSEDLTDNLANEQKKRAELERERTQQIKRREIAELALAVLQNYSAKVQAGDTDAFSSTVTETLALKAFVASLPSFFTGTETNVADELGKPVMSGRDGYMIRADGSEKIFTGVDVAKMGASLTNSEIVDTVVQSRQPKGMDTAAIVTELRRVGDIVDRKPVYMGMDYNELERAITATVVKAGKIERNHQKIGGGLWD